MKQTKTTFYVIERLTHKKNIKLNLEEIWITVKVETNLQSAKDALEIINKPNDVRIVEKTIIEKEIERIKGW